MAKINSKTHTTTEYELTLSQAEMKALEEVLGNSDDPDVYEIYQAIVGLRTGRY